MLFLGLLAVGLLILQLNSARNRPDSVASTFLAPLMAARQNVDARASLFIKCAQLETMIAQNISATGTLEKMRFDSGLATAEQMFAALAPARASLRLNSTASRTWTDSSRDEGELARGLKDVFVEHHARAGRLFVPLASLGGPVSCGTATPRAREFEATLASWGWNISASMPCGARARVGAACVMAPVVLAELDLARFDGLGAALGLVQRLSASLGQRRHASPHRIVSVYASLRVDNASAEPAGAPVALTLTLVYWPSHVPSEQTWRDCPSDIERLSTSLLEPCRRSTQFFWSFSASAAEQELDDLMRGHLVPDPFAGFARFVALPHAVIELDLTGDPAGAGYGNRLGALAELYSAYCKFRPLSTDHFEQMPLVVARLTRPFIAQANLTDVHQARDWYTHALVPGWAEHDALIQCNGTRPSAECVASFLAVHDVLAGLAPAPMLPHPPNLEQTTLCLFRDGTHREPDCADPSLLGYEARCSERASCETVSIAGPACMDYPRQLIVLPDEATAAQVELVNTLIKMPHKRKTFHDDRTHSMPWKVSKSTAFLRRMGALSETRPLSLGFPAKPHPPPHDLRPTLAHLHRKLPAPSYANESVVFNYAWINNAPALFQSNSIYHALEDNSHVIIHALARLGLIDIAAGTAAYPRSPDGEVAVDDAAHSLAILYVTNLPRRHKGVNIEGLSAFSAGTNETLHEFILGSTTDRARLSKASTYALFDVFAPTVRSMCARKVLLVNAGSVVHTPLYSWLTAHEVKFGPPSRSHFRCEQYARSRHWIMRSVGLDPKLDRPRPVGTPANKLIVRIVQRSCAKEATRCFASNTSLPAELASRLGAAGIATDVSMIDPGALSFRDQVRLFSSIDLLVGHDGGALALTAFLPRNSIVVELLEVWPNGGGVPVGLNPAVPNYAGAFHTASSPCLGRANLQIQLVFTRLVSLEQLVAQLIAQFVAAELDRPRTVGFVKFVQLGGTQVINDWRFE